MIELINRARADPDAEATRLGTDLNEGQTADPISSDAKQPLALNLFLSDAAHQYAELMRSGSFISHTDAGGTTPPDRAVAAGFTVTDLERDLIDENIGSLLDGASTDSADRIAAVYAQMFLDDPTQPGALQRNSLFDPDLQEVGAGIAVGSFHFGDSDHPNSVVADQLFARRIGNPFLTGVVYTDLTKADAFYSPGEGLDDVLITATNTLTNLRYSTRTCASGGYSLRVPAGSYAVTATSSTGTATYSGVVVGDENVKRDFITNVDTSSASLLAMHALPPIPSGSSQVTVSKKLLTINGDASDDDVQIDVVGSRIVVTLNGSIARYDLAKVTRIRIDGNDGNDRIVLGDAVPGAVLTGGKGDDTLVSGGGDDDLFGGDGDDELDGGDGNDSLDGGAGDDRLSGSAGNDTVQGGSGDDNIVGGAGKNSLFGGDGNDRLRGSNGPDRLEGQAGSDRLYGDGGDDYLDGGGQSDRIYGGAGADQLIGGSSNDRLYGEDGNDVLFGNAGSDLLDGGDGIDRNPDASQQDTLRSVEN